MIGMERKKENSSATGRESPETCPAAIVHMEREVPGKTAESICTAPIQIACGRFMASRRSMRPFLEKKVDRPHHDATDQKRPAHDCEAFEILTNLFLKKKRWHRRDHERNQRQAERVGQDRAIATFASRKSGDELQNASSKINRQGQNRAELNNDGVHFPKTVAQIEMEQRFRNAQVGRRTYGQKLRHSFNNAEEHGKEVIVHARKSGRAASAKVFTVHYLIGLRGRIPTRPH